MITEENWVNFLVHFFHFEDMDQRWLRHVITNWNPLLNQTACGCAISQPCEMYLEMISAQTEEHVTISSSYSDDEHQSIEPPAELAVKLDKFFDDPSSGNIRHRGQHRMPDEAIPAD